MLRENRLYRTIEAISGVALILAGYSALMLDTSLLDIHLGFVAYMTLICGVAQVLYSDTYLRMTHNLCASSCWGFLAAAYSQNNAILESIGSFTMCIITFYIFAFVMGMTR